MLKQDPEIEVYSDVGGTTEYTRDRKILILLSCLPSMPCVAHPDLSSLLSTPTFNCRCERRLQGFSRSSYCAGVTFDIDTGVFEAEKDMLYRGCCTPRTTPTSAQLCCCRQLPLLLPNKPYTTSLFFVGRPPAMCRVCGLRRRTFTCKGEHTSMSANTPNFSNQHEEPQHSLNDALRKKRRNLRGYAV